MKQNPGLSKKISIQDQILEKYGPHVLECDHPDFDLDIYMMFICRSIEKEMMDYESKQRKAYDDTVKSVETIIQQYKTKKDNKENATEKKVVKNPMSRETKQKISLALQRKKEFMKMCPNLRAMYYENPWPLIQADEKGE